MMTYSQMDIRLKDMYPIDVHLSGLIKLSWLTSAEDEAPEFANSQRESVVRKP